MNPSDAGSLPTTAPVVVIGAGPTGMSAALLLARQGVPVVLLDKQQTTPPHPRCSTVGARMMETLRVLGLADAVRLSGLPADYPCDLVYRTRLAQDSYVLGRGVSPRPTDIFRARAELGAIENWPTPEPPAHINQLYADRILREAVLADQRIELFTECIVRSVTTPKHPVVECERGGKVTRINTRYLLACDGSRSTVRRDLNIEMLGEPQPHEIFSVYVRSVDLGRAVNIEPAWATYVLNAEQSAMVVNLDGSSLFVLHIPLDGTADNTRARLNEKINALANRPVDVELLSFESWRATRQVAERFRSGNVFLLGDAAHVWPPFGGHGMSVGVGDAFNLGWKLGAVINGNLDDALLDTYERERRPYAEIVSQHASALGTRTKVEIPVEIEDNGEVGEFIREIAAAGSAEMFRSQLESADLVLGFDYEALDVVSGCANAPTQVGCRIPHRWLSPNVSTLDVGDYRFAVFSRDPAGASDVSSLFDELGVECRIHVGDSDVTNDHRLVIVRPDHHVAWVGDNVPSNAELVHVVSLRPRLLQDTPA